jgi:Tol biopolymer transport system component
VRFQITPPEGHTLGEFVVSPNGRSLAFTTRDEKGISRLWIRDFEALESRPVAGTEGGRGPFWNPDSSVLGFLVDRTLKKVPIAGGPVATICEGSAGNAMGTAAWSRSGVILVGGTTAGSIRQVPETGGTLTSVTALDRDRGEAVHGLAWWLPDERHFLYVRVSLLGQSGIFVGSIDRKPEEQDREPLVADTGRGVFVEMESQRGRILFLRNGTLMAQPIDLSSYALTGQPVPTAERVSNFGSAGLFSASTKALAYRSGGGSGTGVAADLTWLNDHGQTIKVLGPVQSAFSIELAPDEGRAGVTLAPSMNTDVWVAELDPYKLVRLTTSPTDDRSSIWSPDGRRIAFHSNRTGGRTDLYLKNIDTGAEDLLLHTDESKMPTSWSRDGRFLLFQTNQPGNTDLWVLPLDDRTPSVILKTPSGENTGRFSPDGRWIAYQSNVSGNTQVYVRSFDSALPASPGVVSQVSSKGGSNPRWTRDGKSLVFVAPGGMLTLVDVTTVPRLTVSAPRELFRLPGIPTVPGLQNTAAWDVTRDGKRFLVAVPTGEEARAPITVVLNWGATGSK